MKYCCDCADLMENTFNKGKFRCANSRSGYDEVAANMSACSYFTGVFSSRRGPGRCEELYRMSSRYYILTAISEILGMCPGENKYINAFRYVREEVLPTTEEGMDFIDDYDIYGPIVAKSLKKEEDAISFCNYLIQYYLDLFVEYTENNNIDAAMTVYKDMYSMLKTRYKTDELANQNKETKVRK